MTPTNDHPNGTAMQAALTPVAEAFHNVPDPQPLAWGVTAHLINASHIEPGRARRLDRQDRLTQSQHVGWHADIIGVEILTGFVYACGGEPHGDDDEPPVSYYALAESNDTDCRYLDPAVYDDPVDAARAADRMAESIAELKRE